MIQNTADRFMPVCEDHDWSLISSTALVHRRRLAALEAIAEAAKELDHIFDAECRYDHHGFCQAHFVEKPCTVAEMRAGLAALNEV